MSVLNNAREETFQGIKEFEQTKLNLSKHDRVTQVMTKKSESSKDRDVRRRKLLADQTTMET